MILGLWGLDKSCKTTLACTFPKPLMHMEFDVGGFDRAKHRFKVEVTNGLIVTKPYIMPFQFQDFDPVTTLIRPSKKVVGVKELFYQFLSDYMKHLNNPAVATIVIDTGTLLWEIVCTGYLQEKQETQDQNKPLRISLIPIEYREPNIRMRGIIYQAKAHGKHLVLTHHSRDEFGIVATKDGVVEQRTGKKERSGWTPLGDGADMLVHTYIKTVPIPNSNPPATTVEPWCTIELAEVLEIVGMDIKEPTYEKFTSLIGMIKGE